MSGNMPGNISAGINHLDDLFGFLEAGDNVIWE